MGIQGQLKDMSLTDLIRFNCIECIERRTAQITLDEPASGLRAVLPIVNGWLAHAEMGDQRGEVVVFESLPWVDGTFQLEPDVPAPAWTIRRSHATLLLEGMQRIDEPAIPRHGAPSTGSAGTEGGKARSVRDPGPYEGLVDSVKTIASVTGTLVAHDRIAIAHETSGNPEKEGAVVGIGQETVPVIEQRDCYVGLFLDERASPAMAAARAPSAPGKREVST